MLYARFLGIVVVCALAFTGPWWACVGVLALLLADAIREFARGR